VNRQITAQKVILIDANGSKTGEWPIDVALSVAEREGLDLIEMDGHRVPPIVKLGDYFKERYKDQQRLKAQRRHAKSQQVKEIRLRPKTETHDLLTKTNQIKKFLNRGDKVKITVMMKGRERDHKNLAYDVLQKIVADLSAVGKISTPAAFNGSMVSMTISPLS
jgi:translation initiation factor IF-3